MKNCLFCQISQGKIKSWKIYENDYVYAFLDTKAVNAYHTLVISKKHYQNIFDIPENTLKEIISATKKITTLYQKKLGLENIQIINSSGPEAQQDVFHLHFHIVPRHKGDGQNIQWKQHAELKEKFDELLDKLKEK